MHVSDAFQHVFVATFNNLLLVEILLCGINDSIPVVNLPHVVRAACASEKQPFHP